jgi:p21-activated kinase 2
LCGLNFLHKKNEMNGYLRSDNILINKKGEIKLADFGFACQIIVEC